MVHFSLLTPVNLFVVVKQSMSLIFNEWVYLEIFPASLDNSHLFNVRGEQIFEFLHIVRLLVLVQVALVPGDAFGNGGCIRISYAASMEELQTAMESIESVMSLLKPATAASFLK